MPLTMSLVADLFPPSRRAGASAALGMATGIGVGAGQNLAGLADQILRIDP
jgi:MFS family permease